jgi:hypothetical protein
MTIILGGFFLVAFPLFRATIFLCSSSSIVRKQQQYNVECFGGITCLLSCICQAFSLIFVQSNACQYNVIFNLMRNHICQLSTGAKCVEASMFFWLAAGCLLLMNLNASSGAEELRRGEADANLEESLLQEVV